MLWLYLLVWACAAAAKASQKDIEDVIVVVVVADLVKNVTEGF